MAFLSRRRAIAVKVEATAGTAETLAAGDVVYVDDVSFSPDTPTIERNHHLPTLSKLPGIAGRTMASISFKCLVYGGSAAGTAPFWGKLVQACGFAETVVSSTSVKYLPATTSLKTVTIKAFLDGIVVQMKGCRGSVSMSMTAGEIPELTFNLTGIWEPVTDAAAVEDTALLVGTGLPTFLPKTFKAALFKLDDTYQAIIKSWSWDIANVISQIPDGNITTFKRIDITDRDPSGEFDVESVTKAVFDFWDKISNHTSMQIQGFIGADDSGTGTGTLNVMTDSGKNWPASKWASGFTVRDSAGVVFAISESDGTTLTVSGTPADGDYIIYQAGKLIRVNAPTAEPLSMGDQNADGIYNYGVGLKLRATSAAPDTEIEMFIT